MPLVLESWLSLLC